MLADCLTNFLMPCGLGASGFLSGEVSYEKISLRARSRARTHRILRFPAQSQTLITAACTAVSCSLYCAASCSMDVKYARAAVPVGTFLHSSGLHPACAGVAFLLSHFLVLIFLSVRPRKTVASKFLKPAAGKSASGFLNVAVS